MNRLLESVLAPGLVVVTVMLTACSGNLMDTIEAKLPGRQAEYKTSRSLPALEVPPDLSSTSIQDTMLVPGASSATYSDYTTGGQQQVAVAANVLPEVRNVRIERAGDKRWLVVDAEPDRVWPRMRDFWLQGGFLIEREEPAIGILETDWAENRADIPRGMLRSLLENISTALYSASTRDKFRVRMERGAQAGTTEVFLSHRGAEEVSQGDSFVWQPRPSDPELEAEMLTRMMIYLGVSEERARTVVATAEPRGTRAELLRDAQGATVLSLREDFSRAWRRTGLALDRVGFTVEDRDRSRGLYFVRYIDPDRELAGADGGWFSRLKFWGDAEPRDPDKDSYLVSLLAADVATRVVVLDKQGQRDVTAIADRILSLLHEQLK